MYGSIYRNVMVYELNILQQKMQIMQIQNLVSINNDTRLHLEIKHFLLLQWEQISLGSIASPQFALVCHCKVAKPSVAKVLLYKSHFL